MTPRHPGKRLCVIGAGGFARQILAIFETVQPSSEVVFLDNRPDRERQLGPYPILDVAALTADDEFVVAVSGAEQRRNLSADALAVGASARSLVAASARVSRWAEIAEGAIICDFAVIEPSARIGRHFHANVGAFVAHDCRIADFVTFAPHALCNGNVEIGEAAYIGAGAVIRQGRPGEPLRIGAGAVIGMGAVVTRDVAPGAVVVGNPARAHVTNVAPDR